MAASLCPMCWWCRDMVQGDHGPEVTVAVLWQCSGHGWSSPSWPVLIWISVAGHEG